MKKIFNMIIVPGALMLTSTSCFDLSEDVYSKIPAEGFFKTERDVVMFASRAYVKLQPYPEEQMLWSLTQNASDELIIPARDNGEWLEQGRWREIQQHNVNSSNKILTQSWDFVYEGISGCNEVLYVLEGNPIEFEGKERVLAEVRVLRAFYYFWAADGWGNIPFSIDNIERDAPPQKNRQFIYDYLIEEITSNVDALQAQPTPEYYGHGGKGQVAAAYGALGDLGLAELPMLGVAKGEARKPGLETLIFPNDREPLNLPPGNPALHLIQEIRDEAHRFAITGHRAKRAKARKTSTLDSLPGIGPARRKALINRFGGLDGVREASIDQVAEVQGISLEMAEKIHSALH